jgi:serine/threonine-protein kinase
VLAGLAPLHAHGLVHCDVKAGNILVAGHGVKLIDFGIARPLLQGSAGPTSIGSLHSMSPEQLRGDPLTAGSDIFAVGVVLYQALTGRVPFPGETPAAVAERHAAGLAAGPADLVPGIPEMLDAVVREALELDTTRRFASAEAMTTALQAAGATLAAARPAPPAPADDDTTTFIPVAGPRPVDATPMGGEFQPPPRRGARGPVVMAFVSLAATAVVIAVVASNIMGAARPPADASASSPTQRATPALPAGKVEVPDTIGMSEAEAEAAARAAGLTWRLEWKVDASRPPGVYDQEPPAGRVVDDGARFVMYAYRTR